jgi:HNH endonuclease
MHRARLSWNQKAEILKKQNYLCAYCDGSLAQEVEFDHFVPFAARKLHNASNYVASCIRCNRRKWSHSFGTIEEVREYLRPKQGGSKTSFGTSFYERHREKCLADHARARRERRSRLQKHVRQVEERRAREEWAWKKLSTPDKNDVAEPVAVHNSLVANARAALLKL